MFYITFNSPTCFNYKSLSSVQDRYKGTHYTSTSDFVCTEFKIIVAAVSILIWILWLVGSRYADPIDCTV